MIQKPKLRVNLITLGCSKNLVDSEFIARQLEVNGVWIYQDSNDFNAEIIIINTCGFIQDAKEESIDVILQAINAKKQGLVKKVIVIGCLSQRYKEELSAELPEVDLVTGTDAISDVLSEIGGIYRSKYMHERKLFTPRHYAYLKISEGCNRKCAFCAIPIIRGTHISAPIDNLIKNTQYVVNKGVKELILIAQDLNSYGKDLSERQDLPLLLNKLSRLEKLHWIRLQYLYPNSMIYRILEFMKDDPKICNYLDMPVQHITDKMLKMMKRGHRSATIRKIIDHARKQIPDIAIRTTLIVGHPGETKEDFKAMKRFIEEVQFDRLGVFIYSEEEGTYAAKNFSDTISEQEKQDRYAEFMELQQGISFELNNNKLGKTFEVVVDRREGEYFVGRTQYDSPEVDQEILIDATGNSLKKGHFYMVKITSALEYDLFGTLAT